MIRVQTCYFETILFSIREPSDTKKISSKCRMKSELFRMYGFMKIFGIAILTICQDISLLFDVWKACMYFLLS